MMSVGVPLLFACSSAMSKRRYKSIKGACFSLIEPTVENMAIVAVHEILSSRTLKGGCSALIELLDKAYDKQFAVLCNANGIEYRGASNGATVDSPDEQGRTPLILACARHSVRVIRHVLTTLKASPNTNYRVNPESQHLLSRSTYGDNGGATNLVEELPALTDFNGKSLTLHQKRMLVDLIPLHMIINRTDITEGELLSLIDLMVLDMKADVNACDSDGHNALYLACARRPPTVIKHLLNLGATDAPLSPSTSHSFVAHPPAAVDCPASVRGDEGLYVFSSRFSDHRSSVDETSFPPPLAKRHALTALMLRREIEEETLILIIGELLSSHKGRSDLNKVSSGGHTPLSVACAHQGKAVIAHLLALGADMDGRCADCGSSCSAAGVAPNGLFCARTPLIALVMRNSLFDEGLQAELVKLVVEAGGDLSVYSAAEMSTACRSRSASFKREIVPFGANFHRWALQ